MKTIRALLSAVVVSIVVSLQGVSAAHAAPSKHDCDMVDFGVSVLDTVFADIDKLGNAANAITNNPAHPFDPNSAQGKQALLDFYNMGIDYTKIASSWKYAANHIQEPALKNAFAQGASAAYNAANLYKSVLIPEGNNRFRIASNETINNFIDQNESVQKAFYAQSAKIKQVDQSYDDVCSGRH